MHTIELMAITSPCNVDPLTPHFYIVRLGFGGYTFFLLVFALEHVAWVLFRAASVRRFWHVPVVGVLGGNGKNITSFCLKIIIFAAVKYVI